jgi:hypothetical protein
VDEDEPACAVVEVERPVDGGVAAAHDEDAGALEE